MAMSSFPVLLLVPFITLTLGSSQSNGGVRVKRGLDQAVASAIIDKVAPLSSSSFNADISVLQKVEGGVTNYRIEGIKDIIYQRKGDDSGKEVIVLAPEEDKLPQLKQKRLYIYFKKYLGNRYAPGLAIIRDAGSGDSDKAISVPINGKNSVIELSLVERHLIPGFTIANYLTKLCAGSFIVNCRYNLTAIAGLPKGARFVPKQVTKEKIQEVENLPIVTVDGSDPNLILDYFYDLEYNRLQGGLHGVGSSDNSLDSSMTRGVSSRKKRAAAYRSDAPDYPGWLTQYSQVSKGITLKKQGENYFYGMGNCPIQKPNEGLLNSNNPEQVAIYYLTLLRVECLALLRVLLPALFNKQLVVLKPDKTFDLAPRLYEMNKNVTRLELHEISLLAASLQLVAFSQVYQASKAENLEPLIASADGKKIPRSILIIARTFRTSLEIVRSGLRNHLVTSERVASLSLSNVLIKLAQDAQLLEKCGDCKEDLEINRNSRLLIMALNRMVKKGFQPTYDGDLNQAYAKFFKDNVGVLEKLVDLYT